MAEADSETLQPEQLHCHAPTKHHHHHHYYHCHGGCDDGGGGWSAYNLNAAKVAFKVYEGTYYNLSSCIATPLINITTTTITTTIAMVVVMMVVVDGPHTT